MFLLILFKIHLSDGICTMQKQQSTIPLVQQDAGQEETLLQIAFALDSLESFVKTVFKNIEDSMKKEKTRIQDLRVRCQIAKAKVEKLKGINKSIQVFSSSKYPVPNRDLFFKQPDNSYEVTVPGIKEPPPPLSPDKANIKEKSKFYHVRDSTRLLRVNEEMAPFEGVGPMPSTVRTISSLLLFNTSENLYKQYKLVDPLSFCFNHPEAVIVEDESEIEPAPASIISNEPLGLKYIPNYFYTPISQDVPEIQAPLDLPFLSGIAGDLRFDEDVLIEKPGPSKVVEDKIDFSEEKITLVQELPKVDDIPLASSENLAPPPPPPPPPPPAPEPELSADSEVSMPQPKPRSVVPETEFKPAVVPAPVSDVRANLMEAIRQAGGKLKLKSTSETMNNLASSKKPLSLMDDLHDKLMRRRKGISGKIDNSEGTILDKVATMIPPPPAKQQESEEEDNAEWMD